LQIYVCLPPGCNPDFTRKKILLKDEDLPGLPYVPFSPAVKSGL